MCDFAQHFAMLGFDEVPGRNEMRSRGGGHLIGNPQLLITT